MNRRILTGVLAGVLAAGVLLSVGLGAYRAGQSDEAVTRVAGDGEVVRVFDGRGYHHGPGPGFILFPLLGIGLFVLLAGRGRRGHGSGWCGPGPGAGWGPESRMPESRMPESQMEDWHRRAHGDESAATAPPASPASSA